MNKLLVAVLAAGAAAAAGYVASKVLNGNDSDSDYANDIYDDYEFRGDDSIDFEINDDNAIGTNEEAAEEVKETVEDAVDTVKEAVEEVVD